jgi:hypothetical protein
MTDQVLTAAEVLARDISTRLEVEAAPTAETQIVTGLGPMAGLDGLAYAEEGDGPPEPIEPPQAAAVVALDETRSWASTWGRATGILAGGVAAAGVITIVGVTLLAVAHNGHVGPAASSTTTAWTPAPATTVIVEGPSTVTVIPVPVQATTPAAATTVSAPRLSDDDAFINLIAADGFWWINSTTATCDGRPGDCRAVIIRGAHQSARSSRLAIHRMRS